jgi:hypothetical protein
MNRVGLCDDEDYGAQSIHLHYGLTHPSLRLRRIRYLLQREVQFRLAGLAFGAMDFHHLVFSTLAWRTHLATPFFA